MTKLLGAVLTAMLLVTGTLAGAGPAGAVPRGTEALPVEVGSGRADAVADVDGTQSADDSQLTGQELASDVEVADSDGADVSVEADAAEPVETPASDVVVDDVATADGESAEGSASAGPSTNEAASTVEKSAPAQSSSRLAKETPATRVAPVPEEGVGKAATYEAQTGSSAASSAWAAPIMSAAAPTTISQLNALQTDIVKRTNKLRTAAGVANVKADWRLDAVAQAWSEKQASANKMSHNSKLKTQVPSGWKMLGENVAYGFKTNAQVMTGWRNSAGHYANIINKGYTHMGVGIAYSSSGAPYYTQVFVKYTGMTTPKKPSAKRPFVDVKPGDAHYKAIEWMASSGLSKGSSVTGGKAYKPQSSVSRGAMAAFLYRLYTPKGASGPVGFKKPKTAKFADVPTSHPFFKEIAWMDWSGITKGIAQPKGKPKYAPNSAVSRGAMSAFLYRAEKGKGAKTPARASFSDVKKGHKYFKEVSWMYDRKISQGIRQNSGKLKYEPNAKVSRAAMAAFLYRLKH